MKGDRAMQVAQVMMERVEISIGHAIRQGERS
jgi:hypothetical protein